MNKVLSASAALLLTTGMASAGGLDRSGMGISPVFEDGTYAELSFGMVMPSVSGTIAGGAVSSGNMAQDYSSVGLAYKIDINDNLAFAFIWEQAYGAAIDYNGADVGYPLRGAKAELTGMSYTAVLSYQINDRFSVQAGARNVTMSGQIDTLNAMLPGPNIYNYSGSSDWGYLVGATYEIPDIALRATLTYNSATTHDNTISVGGGLFGTTGPYTMPQSVNLDFQTGIAADTLLLASVRWADWTETAINTQTALGTIDYDNDAVTYTVGVARRFSDEWAGVARVSYEKANGGLASELSPTDGSIGLTLAGIYTMDNMTVTAGINYTKLGDATTETLSADFSGNDALGFGVKIGYSY